jgi:hypothetical protein
MIGKEDKMKILVGYEESRAAEAALKLAIKHAKAFGADLFIVTALEQRQDLQRDDIEAVEDRLEKLKLSFKNDAFPHIFNLHSSIICHLNHRIKFG